MRKLTEKELLAREIRIAEACEVERTKRNSVLNIFRPILLTLKHRMNYEN